MFLHFLAFFKFRHFAMAFVETGGVSTGGIEGPAAHLPAMARCGLSARVGTPMNCSKENVLDPYSNMFIY